MLFRSTLLTGDKQNMYYFNNFIKETNKWDIIIYPHISNIIELINSNNMFIKMLLIDGEIECAYVFKKTCTYIEKNKEIISCICSIKSLNKKITQDIFINGFKNALWSIINGTNNYKYLLIENISDNHQIINNISIKTFPTAVSPMAYFFYNFAYSPFKSEKCLIIN